MADGAAPALARVKTHPGHIHGYRTMREDGRRESPTYTTWRAMIQRCHSKHHRSFKDYGARGVVVVKRWRTFVNFLKDMGPRPPGKTLGRLTPFNDYGPGECEWQTIHQQNKGLNSRADDIVTIDGVSRTKRMWARKLKIKYDTLLQRIRVWGEIEAFTLKKGQRRR